MSVITLKILNKPLFYAMMKEIAVAHEGLACNSDIIFALHITMHAQQNNKSGFSQLSFEAGAQGSPSVSSFYSGKCGKAILKHCSYQLSPDPPRGSKYTNSRTQASDRRIAHNNFNTVQFINIGRPMKSLKISLLHWEYWPNLKVAISPKSERPHPPKLVCMHLTSTPTCMNFLTNSIQLNFFTTMDYNGLKGKLGQI